jgi:lincosamide nucleotidyltransferase A/C/D/E
VAERPRPWTRLTGRVNALVWELPLPRRLVAALSRVVYRNPPMPVRSAVRVLEELESARVAAVVMGGWGLDALIGVQQRVHRDLDLIIDHRDLRAALSALGALGYREWFRNTSPKPYGGYGIEGDVIVVRDPAFRVVDLHPMRLDESGPDPSHGTIGGRPVQCVSAELQIEAQSRYRKRWPSERKHHRANVAIARQALKLEPAERRVPPSADSRPLAQQHSDLA